MVSAKTVLRVVTKIAGLALLAVSATIAYQLSTTSFTAIPVIGALTVFFVALLTVGSFLLLVSS
ncbi:MAG: hypothetical protein NZ941_02045 [Candidatus Caldarchaeum sp.]|nr:hypothetical protein [Candidatus Caldarchaeum sp.]MDW7978064.1 hypothetical protein [Candidatus Caldarchaeum sp.]